MPLRLLYSDDFSGYANDAAFKAAYPWDPPRDMTTSASTGLTWGATSGPGGAPGIEATVGGAYILDKLFVYPQGKRFSIKGTFQFEDRPGSPGTPIAGAMMNFGWADPTDRNNAYAGHIVQVNHGTTGGMSVVVATTPAYGNGSPTYLYGETMAGTPWAPDGTPHTLQVDGRISTLVETSPGVWAPDPDGWVKVFADGVLQFSFSGPIWHNNSAVNSYPGYWNIVSIRSATKFTNLEIWDEIATPGTSTFNGCVVAGRGSSIGPLAGEEGQDYEGCFVLGVDCHIT